MRETAGKKYKTPAAAGYLDFGQSDVFTEWRQPRWLYEGATAEKTEGGRHHTAGM